MSLSALLPRADENPSREHFRHRYQVQTKVGSGACATVYRAYDTTLGRTVALKAFHPPEFRRIENESDPDSFAAQFSAEVTALSHLNNKFIVKLLDACAPGTGDDAYLVLSYHSGGTLRSRAQSPMRPDHVAYIGMALSDALIDVHQSGFIHLDVKPANVLLSAAGRPVLCDFGIAQQQSQAASPRSCRTLGSASYLSPEQALGRALTSASDIYSLGLVLIELLSGTRVYSGSALEAATARLLRAPQSPRWLSPQWRELLTSMVAMNPEDRPKATQCRLQLALLQDSPGKQRNSQ